MARGMNGDGLRPITVRLPPDAVEALEDLWRRNLLSKAEIMRILVTRNLDKHLGDLRIIDKDDAAEIRRQITKLFERYHGRKTSCTESAYGMVRRSR